MSRARTSDPAATEFAGAIAGWDLALQREWWTSKRGSAGRAFRGVVAGRRPYGLSAAPGAVGVLEAKARSSRSRAGSAQRTWPRSTRTVFLFIRGRNDDAINRGGFTTVLIVSEEALRAHPAVRDAAAAGSRTTG